jgi:hypothetical protein
MIPKTTLLALSALVTLAGAQALPGCGGDDCDRAQDHLNECAPDTSSSSSSSSSSSGSGMTLTCAGALLCQADCINNYTCPEINGLAPAFVTCMTACQGK